MPHLPRGLYETLITEDLAARLARLPEDRRANTDELRAAEAPDRIAWHLAAVVEKAIEMLPEDDRVAVGVRLARELVDRIVASARLDELADQRPHERGEVLHEVLGFRPDGTPAPIAAPLIPLLDSALLTNAPGEPNVGHQIGAEIESADRIDLIMAFIRRSGIRPLREALRRHIAAGRRVRVLTTTYTASTEAAALDWLKDLGAEVRVSYDTSGTRLHAKAWLFHRESGFSTAYVGSSNLTNWAQATGLEWNVRLSGARNRSIIDKIEAVFEVYWAQDEFEPYDPRRFAIAVGADGADRERLTLSPIEVRLYPFQERLLEQVELAREQGSQRNLLVAATGTGKTVMAAVDYQRLQGRMTRARLLFVAHREEILRQSRSTFAHALRNASFGEMWVGGRRPVEFEHVFASIQSLNATGLESIPPDHFDVVIVDEFHHAAASSYQALLEHLRPQQLLGLTATPERSDGLPILHWFNDRIAAELRLWDAIDQHRLTPFAYYGVADDLDLREIPWRRGRGYEVGELTNVITATDAWARKVLWQFREHFGDPPKVRALGFCVSVDHARYMARVFAESGVRAVAVTGTSSETDRREALRGLKRGEVDIVFSVDLFNEGVDVPNVDAILMLRPTESPLIFLQQLGRGLRKAEGKAVCTVLDFVGQHRKEFRYDRRFRALLGGSRTELRKQIEQGFPFLPAGCHMELDRVASERVLASVRNALPRTITERVTELADLVARHGDVRLKTYLDETGLDLEDVYSGNHSWSDIRDRAKPSGGRAGEFESILRRACGRLLHVDDPERLERWRSWLQQATPPRSGQSVRDDRLLRMLVSQMLDQVPRKGMSLAEGAGLLWAHPQVRQELDELFEVLEGRLSHLTSDPGVLADLPLRVHARYTRLEILAACGKGEGAKAMSWQTGVFYMEELPADLLAFTFDKTEGGFSPTTRYRDYAINRELIHWESQSVTRAESETGRRYQEHAQQGSHILLFARLSTREKAFHFLGPATYVRHDGERPMAITWRLKHKLPGDLYQQFAAAVA